MQLDFNRLVFLFLLSILRRFPHSLQPEPGKVVSKSCKSDADAIT